MDPHDGRTLSNDALEQLRLQAVRLARRGETNSAIAEILGVNRRTVGLWLKRYAAAGPRALRATRRGRKVGEQRTLTPAQETAVQRLLVDKTPDQLKPTFAFWSRQAVRELLRVRFMLYRHTLDARRLIRFLTRLTRDAGRKVFLILDNLTVYHAKVVRIWLAAHQESIEAFYLPSYAPELNPDEYLDGDLKVGVHAGIPPRSEKALVHTILGHMRMLQQRPDRTSKYFAHPCIRYAAA
jgi:transposase